MAAARATGCTGTLVVRADSAFHSAAFTGAVRRAGAFFPVTVRMDPKVRAVIAAWLACAAIAHNLLRAAGSLASLACARARAATLRRDLIGVAARIARHGRGHITVHLPEAWHRETEWMNLFEATCGPPALAA